MKMLGIVALASFAVLLGGLGSYSQGGKVKKPSISFSLPYLCSLEETYGSGHPNELCLADSFEGKVKVVLVSKKKMCRAETAGAFTDKDKSFEATALTVVGNCSSAGKKEFRIAIIGIGPSVVRVVEPKNDKSVLSKELESRARKIASSAYQEIRATQTVRDAAASPPEVFSVGNAAFLLFKCTDEFLNQDGLPVLVLNDNAFLLNGSCAFRSPFFFSVNGKLHVSYWATVSCCGCGDRNFFVYDVSGESPKLVYQNWNFSD